METIEREPAWTAAIFPTLVLGLSYLAVSLAALDTLGPAGARPAPRDEIYFVALVAGPYGLLAGLEWALPHRTAWRRGHRDVRADVARLALTGPLGGQLGLGLAALSVHARSGWRRFEQWPSAWPPWPQLALAVTLAEFGHYVRHRISHEVGWVWRLHAVHPSAPRLYWLNASRFHPLDLIARTFCQPLPLLVLGIPPRAFLLYAAFASC